MKYNYTIELNLRLAIHFVPSMLLTLYVHCL